MFTRKMVMQALTGQRMSTRIRVALLTALLLAGQLTLTASADEFVWAPQQPLGGTLPDFTALDTSDKRVALSDLLGEKGTLLVFSRSADW